MKTQTQKKIQSLYNLLYLRNGEKDLAINSYQTAVKLDTTNGYAAAALKELK